MSANLEARANSLRQEALQCITVALAGSDTKKFWSLMTAYFGTSKKDDGEDDPWDFIDAASAIPEPLPLTETDTDDESTSVKSTPAASSATPAPKPSGVAKQKPRVSTQKDLLDDLCSMKAAIRMYPANSDTLKETGIPPNLQVKREQRTTGKGGSIYLCLHSQCQTPTFWAQSPTGLYSHVRRKHLGIVLACPYCPDKLYWNSMGWKSHMEHQHRNLPAYGSALPDEAAVAKEMLTSMEKQASSTKPPAKKRCRASSPKVKSESAQPGSVEEPSPASSNTEDSFSDSDSSSSSDSDHDSGELQEPERHPEQASVPQPGLASATAVLVSDMPPLKKSPPKFPEYARSSSKKHKKQQD